jgi:hypothetical protein
MGYIDMAIHELVFSELEPYQVFLRNTANTNKKGVYVWGFCFVNPVTAVAAEFKPYYAGKSEGTIHKRIQEHVESIRNGTHTVMKLDTLRNEKLYKKVDLNDSSKVAYSNLALRQKHGPGNYPKHKLSFEEQISIIPHINCYIDNLFVTYLSADHISCDNERNDFISKLERYVQDIFGDRVLSYLGSKYDRVFVDNLKISTNIGTSHFSGLFSKK